MKKYKIRLTGLGIEAVAIIPFETEPTIEQLHSKIIEYLDHKLFKIEGIDDIAVLVKKAEGEQCSRCWKILGNPCKRCGSVLINSR